MKAVTEYLRFIQNNKVQSLLFVLLVFLLPTQFGKHFWPSFAFINGLRIDYLSPTLYTTDVLAVFFIFSATKRIYFSSLFFLFLLILSVGIYLSIQPMSGWYGFLKIIEYAFLWNALLNFFKEKKETVTLLSLPLLSGVIFESLLAIWQYLYQQSVGGFFYFFGERTFSASTPGIANASVNGELILRPYGTLSHPNVLAAFLLFGCSVIFYKIFKEKNIFYKLLFVLGFLLGSVALFLTLGRIAIVLWVLTILYLLIINIKIKKNIRIFIAVIITLVFAIVFFLISSRSFVRLENISLSDESVVQRVFLISKAWQMFKISPLFGVGFDNFLINLSQTSGMYPVFLLQPVHNIFFLSLTETGIFCFFMMIMFFYKTIKKIIISFKSSEKKEFLPLYLLLLCQFFILGQLDHYFLTLQQGQLLTVLIFSLCWSI